jgi:restriction system protein
MPSAKKSRVSRMVASALAVLKRSSGTPRPAKPDGRLWSAQLLKQLEWRRFEELCAAYFELQGFGTRIARTNADGGVDLHLCAAGSEKAAILVHCKAWNAYRVGIEPVRALRSAMAAAKIGAGRLVTSSRFTQEAVELAAKHNIQLVDGAALLAGLAALPPEKALALLKFATQGDYQTPTCPSCGVKMISRKSTSAGRKYWGCRNYPRCKHTVAALMTP